MVSTEVAAQALELAEDQAGFYAWQRLRQAQVKLAVAKRELDLARELWDRFVGGQEEFQLNGSAVATYRYDGAFQRKRFQDENPHLAQAYITWVAEEKFDVNRFQADNPDLYEQYRARTLRISQEA